MTDALANVAPGAPMAAALPRAANAPVWRRDLSPTLARVMQGEICAGCGLCAAIAPEKVAINLSPEGYARPYAEGAALTATEEARVSAACPGAIIAPWRRDVDFVHDSWGPIRGCAEGHAVDIKTRFGGSSGGLLSALAIHALESGLVDSVVHVQADPAEPMLNRLTISLDRAAVLAAAGSRYGPSPLLAGVAPLLEDSRRFLIIGKPCDISALRSLAAIDERVDARFPFMLSFFCGGMPSIKGSEAIVAAMGLADAAITRFRYRGNGWPGSARAETADGRASEMSYADSWGKYLSGRVQYRCKICPDAVGGSADIAAADAWYGGESGYPRFDERDGRSLILVRSEAGARLLAAATMAGHCQHQPLPVDEVNLMQPAQARRKRLIVARTLAARLLLQPMPVMRGLQVAAAARNGALGEQLRNLFGSMRRILTGRR